MKNIFVRVYKHAQYTYNIHKHVTSINQSGWPNYDKKNFFFLSA